MSFMEEQVLGYKSPLYGRRTAQFKIHPFTFFEAKELLTEIMPEDQAILYGITGGVPEYLSRIDRKANLDDNIIRLFFEESGRMFEEPGNLIKQELKEPMTESPASRRTLYSLNDNMFLFWYRFVRPNISGIMRGVGDNIYKTLVKTQMNDFMGSVFEEICQQYLYRPDIYDTLPFPIGNIGRWWGNNPKERRQLFHFWKKYYFLFSKSGFAENVRAYAAGRQDVTLVAFRDMV